MLIPAFQFQYSPPVVVQPSYVPQPNYVTQPNYGVQQPSYAPQPNYGVQQPSYAPQPNYGMPQPNYREFAKASFLEMQRQDAGNSGNSGDNGPPTAIDPHYSNLPIMPSSGGIDKAALANFAVAALQRNCAACHTGQASKGGSIIFSQPGVLDQFAPFRTMAKDVETGRMPPVNAPFRPTGPEVNAMVAWLKSIN